MPTLKYRPVLAYIHQLDDGTYDFYAHNMEIEEDENGDSGPGPGGKHEHDCICSRCSRCSTGADCHPGRYK